jgi:uncharacterized glyoxalase superfamily protein PhnB
MQVQPYLFLDVRCEEAIEFYRKALGAEVLTHDAFQGQPAARDEPSWLGREGDAREHAHR